MKCVILMKNCNKKTTMLIAECQKLLLLTIGLTNKN